MQPVQVSVSYGKVGQVYKEQYMRRFFVGLWIACGLAPALPAVAETVIFKAEDGLVVTADLRQVQGAHAAIVLFHMAGASRGEYRDITPDLNALGYTTLAVDQRSGSAFNGVKNETAARAKGSQPFEAALPDLRAASAWARKNSGAKRIAVLGSSYSSSLVLVASGQDKNFADAVMSFSPGEYFPDKRFVRDAAKSIAVPVFLTSARNEANQTAGIGKVISQPVTHFIPQKSGRHGATALVSGNGAEYWVALKTFLKTHFSAN